MDQRSMENWDAVFLSAWLLTHYALGGSVRWGPWAVVGAGRRCGGCGGERTWRRGRGGLLR